MGVKGCRTKALEKTDWENKNFRENKVGICHEGIQGQTKGCRTKE